MPQRKPEYNESVPTARRGDRRKSHETPIVDILHVVHLTCSNQARQSQSVLLFTVYFFHY